MNEWEKQRKEINSYNTFFSAVTGRKADETFSDIEFDLVGYFMRIEDSRNDVEAEPDFVLYNGETLLLVEVKSGENISERHKGQVEAFNELSIESAEDFLKNAEYGEAEVTNIQGCIVYDEEFLEKCEQEWENCEEELNDIKDKTAVLGQKRDSKLKLNGGELNGELEELLDDGIGLPKNPKTEILLSEGVEHECLAVSICHDHVLPRLKNGKVELTPAGVTNLYPSRETPLDHIKEVLEFLDHVGACSTNSDGEYVFKDSNLKNIMDVISKVEEKMVSEYIGTEEDDENDDGDEAQSGLDKFS